MILTTPTHFLMSDVEEAIAEALQWVEGEGTTYHVNVCVCVCVRASPQRGVVIVAMATHRCECVRFG